MKRMCLLQFAWAAKFITSGKRMISDGHRRWNWIDNFKNIKKGQQGISCSWLASRICLSFTGCHGMFTPPFSEGTRTKMLTHFLHHVTLIRWTLLAQELNTLRSRAAVTSQPASCFFRDHVTGISGDGRVAGPRKPANKIKYKQLTMTVFKTIWCYELGRHLCNLKQHQSSKPQHLKHTVSTNVSCLRGRRHTEACVWKCFHKCRN